MQDLFLTSKKQDLDSRKHVLDFFFPIAPLSRFFFSAIFAGQAFFLLIA